MTKAPLFLLHIVACTALLAGRALALLLALGEGLLFSLLPGLSLLFVRLAPVDLYR